MPTRLSVLPKPRDVHVHNLIVADKITNVENSNTKRRLSEDGLRALFSVVAPNAILNAGGRADEVRCCPGTREQVIDIVETWMDEKNESPLTSERMMWLSGPAGAGKSAIMQTVAERQKARGASAPSCFFFRGDGTQNHANHVVATLLYQLMDIYPCLKEVVEIVLSADGQAPGSPRIHP